MVYDLATTGTTDDNAFKTSVNSLFVDNPASTLDVYGVSVNNLQVGITTLMAQMKSGQVTQTRNVEITRYVLSLMILQKKLLQTDGMHKISQILETAESQKEHFGMEHDNVIATIARAYSENVSVLHPRIMVNGQHGHLNNQRVANKIRALLLAGLRSAILWYQVGGSRWGLIWSRKKYLQGAQALYRPEVPIHTPSAHPMDTKDEAASNVSSINNNAAKEESASDKAKKDAIAAHNESIFLKDEGSLDHPQNRPQSPSQSLPSTEQPQSNDPQSDNIGKDAKALNLTSEADSKTESNSDSKSEQKSESKAAVSEGFKDEIKDPRSKKDNKDAN